MLVSCHREFSYPSLLVTADSLMMQGHYYQSDSLLALYDQHPQCQNEAFVRYRQLLFLERLFVDGDLSDNNFSLADSLCRYYDNNNSINEYSKALCFLGDICRVSEDYSSAMKAFLKAEELARKNQDSYLLCWVYQKAGDILFCQRMYEESADYHQKYYQIATANHDTLRMAYAAFDLGMNYTAKNNVDSTIYYYKYAIELAPHTKRSERIIPPAYNSLCDIYIQIEEFEKAREYMMNDSTDDNNWAYWHLGQNHVDSAIWYFEKIKNRYNTISHLETCHNLAQLEEKKGNTKKALYYYGLEKALSDSVKAQSQANEIKKVETQYRLNMIREERDKISRHSDMVERILYITFALLVIVCVLGFVARKYHHKQKIADLEQSLADAHRQSSKYQEAVDRNIELMQRMQQCRLEVLDKSELYNKIKANSKKADFHLSDSEWQELSRLIDEAYGQFTQRLQVLADVSLEEMRTCYLLKINVAPIDISSIVCKSKEAISMQRKRLYEKVTKKKGTAKDFDKFIAHF